MTGRVKTVVLHDASQVEIPVEFYTYYCQLGLIKSCGCLRDDLMAKEDRANGGLRFQRIEPEPVVDYPANGGYYSQFCVLGQSLIEGTGSQEGWDYYERLQREWRMAHGEAESCRGCGQKFQAYKIENANVRLRKETGLCSHCRNKGEAWKKLLEILPGLPRADSEMTLNQFRKTLD